MSSERNIVTYPFIAEQAIPGRCRHQVVRLGQVEACARPATHSVAGVGLCATHLGQYEFWQRGGQIGTPQEIFDRLVADGQVGTRQVDRRTGEETVFSVRAPTGWAIATRKGGRVVYSVLERFPGPDGEWRWRLAYPTGGRRRVSRRSVGADALLKLDREDVSGNE